MKKLLVNIILMLTLLHSQFYNSFVAAGYEINHGYYAEELCENKDKPELHCEGRCFLAKQLGLDEEKQEDTEPPSLLPLLNLFSPPQLKNSLPGTFADAAEKFFNSGQQLPQQLFLAAIEHPPRV